MTVFDCEIPPGPPFSKGRIRGRCRPLGLLLACVAGCAAPAIEEPAAAAESWSVTAWGATYEVFPEAGPLVVGEAAVAHTHVTRLADFAPLVDGTVEIVLAGPSGEQVFASDQAVRPGIFNVEIRPEAPGDFDLAFRITTAEGREEIRGGKVRVGSAQQPGGLLVAPAPKGVGAGGEPLAFLKEEQWRSDFATGWVRSGELAGSVSGLVRVRPPAGGEATLTAPVDGVLHALPGSAAWPFVGQRAAAGDALLRVVPRVAADRSLSALEAELATLTAERQPARARLARLEELLALEATSRREVEDARARLRALEARHDAADRDLEAARSSRQGGAAGSLTLRAPFAGRIAAVDASPGATVAAGDPLARLVRTDLLWLEAALPPQGARRIAEEGVTGVVLTDPESPPVRIEEGLKLVAVAPELAPRTGTVTVLLAAPATAGLTLGTTLQAQLLLSEQREGVVIPAAALIDDGGVSVVYLQLSGESFVRQQVRVLERQGDRLLVDGLRPGQRLVGRGGESIRRSSLMAGGAGHGHVH